MTIAPDILPVVAPAEHMPGPPQGQWTYADYRELPEDGHKYELIEGVLYMAPAPTDTHQNANSWFLFYLITYVRLPGLGRVFGAPLDVRIAGENTVQPDVLVVLNANLELITPAGVMGAPDLVVEIASPSTSTYDRAKKLQLYERGGVREYWIADPIAKTIELLVLDQAVYRSLGVFHGQATLPSTVVPNLPVHVSQFFA